MYNTSNIAAPKTGVFTLYCYSAHRNILPRLYMRQCLKKRELAPKCIGIGHNTGAVGVIPRGNKLLCERMTKGNEAFSCIMIDAQLKNQDWNTHDQNSVFYAKPRHPNDYWALLEQSRVMLKKEL